MVGVLTDNLIIIITGQVYYIVVWQSYVFI